jgi:hypothetical protein
MSGRDTADQPCENRLSCGPSLFLAPPMCRYLAAFTCETSVDPWLRGSRNCSGRRAVGGQRHTAVPHDASIDSQAPAPTFGTNPEAEGHRQHRRIRARAAAQASGYLFDLDTFCNGPRPPRLVLDEAAPRRDPVDGILTSSSGRSFP